jgi:excisionase family DNA binding protein
VECLWNAAQVAEFLGVSQKLVYRMAAEGRLPSIQITERGAVRFNKADIVQWVESKKRQVTHVYDKRSTREPI